MDLTPATLRSLFTGFSAAFNVGFTGVEPAYRSIAMIVPSSAREETYAWLGEFPAMREWVGDRVINSLAMHGYTIKNRSFESTVEVGRDVVEDDRYGVFGPIFQELGRAAAEKSDELVCSLLPKGFGAKCYDEQSFFDTDHPMPVGDEMEGATVSNMQDGNGSPWFLLDCSRAIKPLIYQERRPFNTLIKKDAPEDDNVFMRKQYLYGVDGRANAGYGLWQLAFASKAPLTAANYEAARLAMMGLTGRDQRPLGVKPDTLVVPQALEGAAMRLLNNGTRLVTQTEDGTALDAPLAMQNEWAGTAKPIVTPWAA